MRWIKGHLPHSPSKMPAFLPVEKQSPSQRRNSLLLSSLPFPKSSRHCFIPRLLLWKAQHFGLRFYPTDIKKNYQKLALGPQIPTEPLVETTCSAFHNRGRAHKPPDRNQGAVLSLTPPQGHPAPRPQWTLKERCYSLGHWKGSALGRGPPQKPVPIEWEFIQT